MTKPLGFSGPASGVGIDLGRHMLVYLWAKVTIPMFFLFPLIPLYWCPFRWVCWYCVLPVFHFHLKTFGDVLQLKLFLPMITFNSPPCWTCAPQIFQHNPQTSFFLFLLFLEPLKEGMNTSWLSSIILHEKIFGLHLFPIKCEVLVLPNKGGRWSPKPSSLAEVPNVLADIKFVMFQSTYVQ